MKPTWLTELAKPVLEKVEQEEIKVESTILQDAPENMIVQSGTSSSVGKMPEGVVFQPLVKAVWDQGPTIMPYFENLTFTDDNRAYNYSKFSAGAFLHVKETIEEPLKLRLISGSNLVDRNLIVLEANTKATLIVETVGDGEAYRNGEFDIRLEEGSELTLIEVQQFKNVDQHVYKGAVLKKDAILNHVVVGLDAKGEERNFFHLTGEGSYVNFNQAQLGLGKTRRQVKTHALHSARNTKSRLNTKTVAGDTAHIVSIGKVLIEKDAQQTDSNLTDHGLMLSEQSQVTAVPALEVHADDVHAGHANSASRINDDHLFYLMSRGLTEKEAKKTIILSFLESVLQEQAQYIDTHSLFEAYWDDQKSGAIRKEDFPTLKQKIHAKNLVYLDSAATSQKPKQVIEAVKRFYEEDNANIHRGMHTLSERATERYEEARETVAGFINSEPEELIFVRNATEGLNLLAQTLGKDITDQDSILLTEMEHHSNIVPWKLLAQETGAELRWVPVLEDGTLNMNVLDEELARKPTIIAINHVSNVLGTINPVKEIIEKAKDSIVIVDGAQSVPHLPVDVKSLGCDALVFSGHKMLGPTGIGAVYVKKELLEKLPPYMGGGGMIKEVSKDNIVYKDGPQRYEAGTPNVAAAIGLAEAVKYLQNIGMYHIARHNMQVVQYALEELGKIPQVKLYGPEASKRAGAVAFTLGDMHGHDVAQILDDNGVAIRSGHHCAQLLMDHFGVADLCRASFHMYNSKEDVDSLVKGLKKAIEVFKL